MLEKPGPRKKRKKSKPRVTEPESVIQARAEEYLTIRGIKPIRIPDKLFSTLYGQNSVNKHAKAFIANYLKGLPDLIIPKITEHGTIILPLEIKTEAGELSRHQLAWKERLNTVVARGWEETKKAIDDFLDN